MVKVARNGPATRTTVESRTVTTAPGTATRDYTDPVDQAYWLLRVGFIIAPLIAGLDKFGNVLVDWPRYLAPWASNLVAGPYPFMYVVGVIEIIGGIGVAIMPRVFAYLVAAWLAAIVITLLSYPGYYDIALRDVGLCLGAIALGRLASVCETRREPDTNVATAGTGASPSRF